MSSSAETDGLPSVASFSAAVSSAASSSCRLAEEASSAAGPTTSAAKPPSAAADAAGELFAFDSDTAIRPKSKADTYPSRPRTANVITAATATRNDIFIKRLFITSPIFSPAVTCRPTHLRAARHIAPQAPASPPLRHCPQTVYCRRIRCFREPYYGLYKLSTVPP